jgi:hypothetical protein
MQTIDDLGSKIRPNTFILPNTDAGGGVGYDDMTDDRNPFPQYGTWVNGGVWTTQEARLMMAYYRTNRTDAVANSMATMLSRFANEWRMDAPLPDFGATTWANVRCAFSDRNLHSRMPLDPTPVRLKRTCV